MMKYLQTFILAFLYLLPLNGTAEEDHPVVKCDLLEPPENADLVCTHANLTNPCSDRQNVGTVAQYKCKQYYIPSGSRVSSLRGLGTELHCRQNGSWTNLQQLNEFTCSEDCGKRLANPKPLIIHGVATNRTVWPWHAAIYRRRRGKYEYICGGTVIRRGVILTAAHCVATDEEIPVPLNADQFKVIVGAVTLEHDDNMRAEGTQGFQVRKIYISENYNPKKDFHADIAVLHLAGDMKFNDNTLPACLPNEPAIDLNALKTGKFGEIVGFGIDETGEQSKVLKHVSLQVMSHAECLNSLKQILGDSQFCAGNHDGTKLATVCNGDSGGGYVYPSTVLGKYYVHGIVSTGDRLKDGICQNYGVFTRVFIFVYWVRDVLEQISGTVIRELATSVRFPFVLHGAQRDDGEIDRFRFGGIPRELDWQTVEFTHVDLDPKLLLENLEYTKTIQALNLTVCKLDTLVINRRVRLPFLKTFVLDIVKDDFAPTREYPVFITEEYLKSFLFFERDPDEYPITWSMKDLTKLGVNIELTVSIFKLVTVRHDERKIALSHIPFSDRILEHVPVADFKLQHLALHEGSLFSVESLLNYKETLEHLILSKMHFKSETFDYDEHEELNLGEMLSSLKKLTELRIVTARTAWDLLDDPSSLSFQYSSVALEDLPKSLKQLAFGGNDLLINYTRPVTSTKVSGGGRIKPKSKPRFHFPNLETFACDFCALANKTRENFHWVFKNIRRLMLRTQLPFNIKRLVDRMENLEHIYISNRDEIWGSQSAKVVVPNFYGLAHFDGFDQLPNDTQSFILERVLIQNVTTWTIKAAAPEDEHREEFMELGLANFWTSVDEYEVLSRLTPNELKAKHTGVYKFNGSTADPDEFHPIRTIPKLLQPYIKSIEISDAQVIPEVMQFSIRECVNLESLIMTNVKVLGLFDNRLIELPKVKEYKLSRRLFSSHLSQKPTDYIRELDEPLYVATFPFEEFDHDPETNDRLDFVSYAYQPYQSAHLKRVYQDYGGCVLINMDQDAGVLVSSLFFTRWILEDMVQNTDNDPPLARISLRGQKLNNITTFIPATAVHLNLDYSSFKSHNEIPELLGSGNVTELTDLRLAHNYVAGYSELLSLNLSDFREVANTLEFLELTHAKLTYSDPDDELLAFGDQLQLVHLESCVFENKTILDNFSKIFSAPNLILVGYSIEEGSVEWIEDALINVLTNSTTKADWIYVERVPLDWNGCQLPKLLESFGVPKGSGPDSYNFLLVREAGHWSAVPGGQSGATRGKASKLASLKGKTTHESEFGPAGCEGEPSLN